MPSALTDELLLCNIRIENVNLNLYLKIVSIFKRQKKVIFHTYLFKYAEDTLFILQKPASNPELNKHVSI